MINNLLIGLKSIRYASGKIGIFVTELVYILVSVFIMFTGKGINSFLSIYFITIAPMIFIHLYYSTISANVILSSPLKKKLLTSIPTGLLSLFIIIGFLLALINVYIQIHLGQLDINTASFFLLLEAIVILTLFIFFAVSNKKFIVSVIITIPFIYIIIKLMHNYLKGNIVFNFPIWSTIILCIISLIVGSIISYFITLLLYKEPFDKLAIGSVFRKEI